MLLFIKFLYFLQYTHGSTPIALFIWGYSCIFSSIFILSHCIWSLSLYRGTTVVCEQTTTINCMYYFCILQNAKSSVCRSFWSRFITYNYTVSVLPYTMYPWLFYIEISHLWKIYTIYYLLPILTCLMHLFCIWLSYWKGQHIPVQNFNFLVCHPILMHFAKRSFLWVTVWVDTEISYFYGKGVPWTQNSEMLAY